MVEHGSDAVGENPIGALGDRILLWCCLYCALAIDASFATVGFEVIADVFASLVISQCSKLLAGVALSIRNVLLELGERLALLLHHSSLSPVALLIREGDPIAVSRVGTWDWSFQIGVDEFEEA